MKWNFLLQSVSGWLHIKILAQLFFAFHDITVPIARKEEKKVVLVPDLGALRREEPEFALDSKAPTVRNVNGVGRRRRLPFVDVRF